jgi:glycosyltransferase involved in cell wall biosynthesis
VLIEALARVPEVDGLIVGGHPQEPDLERLRTLAQRLGLEQRITFAGMVAPSAVAALLKRATMLALPNPASAIATRFTSPLKLFEYMAAGRPIVASNLPAIREVLTDNVDALLVPPGDAGALADAIRRLARDPALGERLSRAALDLVPQYTWTRRAERLESLFDEVVGSR